MAVSLLPVLAGSGVLVTVQGAEVAVWKELQQQAYDARCFAYSPYHNTNRKGTARDISPWGAAKGQETSASRCPFEGDGALLCTAAELSPHDVRQNDQEYMCDPPRRCLDGCARLPVPALSVPSATACSCGAVCTVWGRSQKRWVQGGQIRVADLFSSHIHPEYENSCALTA